MIATSFEQMSRDIQAQIIDLMNQQGLGVLSTKDEDGHPYASLIAFAPNTDHTRLFFVTPKATRKFANLLKDSRVALLINNSANDLSDFHQAMAVTVLGQAKLVAEGDMADILPLYLHKHPYLKQFANDAACALMAIHISGFTMVQQFQNPTKLGL